MKIGSAQITKDIFYRIGFWFLIIFMLGVGSGVYLAKELIINGRISDAIKLGGIVIDNKVYDLKERI